MALPVSALNAIAPIRRDEMWMVVLSVYALVTLFLYIPAGRPRGRWTILAWPFMVAVAVARMIAKPFARKE